MIERNDIEKLIVQHKKSNLINHWKDALFLNTFKYSGEIKPDEILLWRPTHFLRGAYPVFHISFDLNGKLKGIRIEKNPYHKFLNKFFIALFAIILTIIFLTIEFRLAVIMTCGMAFIGFLLNIVLNKSKKFERKQITDELQQTIENIEREKHPELVINRKQSPEPELKKEWTFSKILTRLVAYPFCGLVVYFSITSLIPSGEHRLGIAGVVIGLIYPMVDLLIAFRIKIKTSN